MDKSFIDLLSDNNIKRISIDPRLIVPFKNVMIKMQEYFNANGYTTQRNYKDFFEKFLLSEIIDKLKILVDNEPSKIGASGIYRHNNEKQEIHIDERYLNTQEVESTLCHEFIHFLVMRDLSKTGHYDIEIKDGGFINEALTEMLTQQIYPNSKSYKPQVEMLKYANLLTNNVNNFSLFLRGHVDSRRGATSWLHFYDYVQEYQKKFRDYGFYLNDAVNDVNYINAQREIIAANIHTHLIRNFEQYTDFINKLNKRVVPDDVWIEDFILQAEKTLSATYDMTYGQTKEIKIFITNKLKEYRNLLKLKDKYNGKDVIEIEVGGKKVAFDEKGNMYDQETGRKYYGSYQMGFYGNIRKISINGDERKISLTRDIFSKRKEDIEKRIKGVSKFFSTNIRADLKMLKENINTENLVKIERFELPKIDNLKRREFYVATYLNHIEILGLKKMLNETVHNHLHFRFRGINPTGNEIFMTELEPIEYGVIFSNIDEKLLSNGIKNIIYQELEENNPEISEDELYDIVDERYRNLNEEELNELENQVVSKYPKCIVSTKDGEIDISIINGVSAISATRKEVLVSTKIDATYNEYFKQVQRNNIGKKNIDSITLPVDSNGNIVRVKNDYSDDNIDYSEAEPFEEDLPYITKIEEQNVSSFPKFKSVKQTKRQNFVQQSSSKQQDQKIKIQSMDDKNKEQESQKRKDNIEELKKMQEILGMAKQQKIGQDFINNQETIEEIEDHGMSM